MSNEPDLRHATPREVLDVLASDAPLEDAGVRALLSNAFERLAALEAESEEARQAFRWFTEQMRKGEPTGESTG